VLGTTKPSRTAPVAAAALKGGWGWIDGFSHSRADTVQVQGSTELGDGAGDDGAGTHLCQSGSAGNHGQGMCFLDGIVGSRRRRVVGGVWCERE
jgi:hypothetical protein